MQESTTSATLERSIDEIIAELDQEYTGKFPEQAIRDAQRRKEEITPRLIELIRAATAMVRAGEQPRGEGHLIALFLLTEFRAKQALPAIVEAISLPGDGSYDLFGDTITEDLSRILAALAADTPDVIEQLTCDREVNEYVRSAADHTYLYWVRDGRISRDEAVERLREHLRMFLTEENVQLITMSIVALVEFSPVEAREEIEEAFRRNLAETFFIRMQDVEESVAGGEEWFQKSLQRCGPTGIDDTVEELSKWHCYQPDQGRIEPPHYLDQATFDETTGSDFDDEPWDYGATIRNETPKVGRNEPCPCGSGKKFKKCCGAAK